MLLAWAATMVISDYQLETYVRAGMHAEALNLRATLMATRRIYHQQFLASGLPLTDQTIGFLPAHAMSRISRDFSNWADSGVRFNNVSDRPRNPENRADPDELRAMDWFRRNPTASEYVQDIRNAEGQPYFHFAAPIWVEPYCLQCHGRRDAAPPAVAQTYGDAYDYRVGDLRGVMSIKIPYAEVRDRATHLWFTDIAAHFVSGLLIFLTTGGLMSALVTRRLSRIEAVAGRFTAGDYAARCQETGTDEVAALAHRFDHMAEAIAERDQALKKTVERLQDQGDEVNRQRQLLEQRVRERTADLEAAKEAADQANAAKSVFLANMSHEIRTPMNAIVGFTHILRRDNRDPQQQERLAKIAGAAEHLLRVINDILDFSKIEAGKLSLDEQEFSLDALLAEVVQLAGDRSAAKGLHVGSSIDPALSGRVRGDPLRLKQILVNLVGNAIKFTDHGEVAISATVRDETPGRRTVLFEVVDTGIGISPETQDRLFHPFEQADASTTRAFGGSGLGLAISRRLVGLMGGEIGVVSKDGLGSKFWFTAVLGLAAPGDPADASAWTEPAEVRLMRQHLGARVLLAEDNPVNQEVALELLADVGLAVDLAQNGAQAVALASAAAYDIILLDLQMPELDGLEAARAIRRLPRHGTTPIIAMTASAFTENRQTCLEAGMDDHIGKPVDPENLYALLLRWLDGGKGGGAPA